MCSTKYKVVAEEEERKEGKKRIKAIQSTYGWAAEQHGRQAPKNPTRSDRW